MAGILQYLAMSWYGGTPDAESALLNLMFPDSGDEVIVVKQSVAVVEASPPKRTRSQLYAERVAEHDRRLLATVAQGDEDFVSACRGEIEASTNPAARLLVFNLKCTIGDALNAAHEIVQYSCWGAYVGITCGPLFRWCREGVATEGCSVKAHHPTWPGRMHLIFQGTASQCASLEARVIAEFRKPGAGKPDGGKKRVLLNRSSGREGSVRPMRDEMFCYVLTDAGDK